MIVTLCGMVQAPVQALVRPSTWIPGLKKLHSHKQMYVQLNTFKRCKHVAFADPETTFFCVLFFQSSSYITEGRTDQPREKQLDPLGPIASRGGSVPEFLRKPITTCDLPGGGVRTPCTPFWIRPCVEPVK